MQDSFRQKGAKEGFFAIYALKEWSHSGGFTLSLYAASLNSLYSNVTRRLHRPVGSKNAGTIGRPTHLHCP